MDTPASSPASALRRILTDPAAAPSAAEVAALAEAYPYLTLPAALRLSRVAPLSAEERRHLIGRVAVGAPGRDTLFRLLDPDGDLLAGFMPPEEKAAPTASDTDSAIDTFLSTYGSMSPAEEALLEKMIFNPPPPDYMALLAEEGEELPEEKSLDEAAAALTATPPSALPSPPPSPSMSQQPPSPPPALPSPPSSSSLSESLAQVYIRRGRYDKAYDIIHALSLNNPKKSVYFADQLRFLQKLMLIERHKSGAQS